MRYFLTLCFVTFVGCAMLQTLPIPPLNELTPIDANHTCYQGNYYGNFYGNEIYTNCENGKVVE